MSNYYFADISHHKGELDISVFAQAGHRLVISKASDSYHLPDKEGNYNFAADRHYDSRFVENYVKTRENGLAAGAYHFFRFDRPLPVTNRVQIVKKNLEYFQIAIGMLPSAHQDIQCVILDIEQSATQLIAAGLNKASVSDMAIDMVKLFAEHYKYLILYSGSWWTNEWLTWDCTEWMAERMAVWEPEYRIQDGSVVPPDVDYQPSVPKGFSTEYVTSVDDFNGKMFAWQFSSKGNFFGVNNIDTNQYRMPKDEVFKLFNTDGSVDPPEPPVPPVVEGIPKEDVDTLLAELAALRFNDDAAYSEVVDAFMAEHDLE